MSKNKSKKNDSKQLVSVFDDPPRKNVLLLSCMDQRLLDDTVKFMNSLNLQNRYDQLAVAGSAMGVNQLPEDPVPAEAKWWNLFTTHLSAAINTLHRPIKDVFLVDHLDCGAYKYLYPDDAIKAEYSSISKQYGSDGIDRMIELHSNELLSLAERVRDYCDEQDQAAEAEFAATEAACHTPKKKDAKKAGKKDDKEPTCWDYVGHAAEEKRDAWKNIRVSCFIIDLRGHVMQLAVPDDQKSSSAS